MSKFYLIKCRVPPADQINEMDRPKDTPKAGMTMNKKKIAIFGLSGVLVIGTAGFFFSRGKGHEAAEESGHSKHASAKHGHESKHEAKSESHDEGKQEGEHEEVATAHAVQAPSIVERIELAATSIQQKVEALRRSEQVAERLQLENANLRLKLEAVQLDCRIADATAHTKGVQSKLLSDTQTKIGRTLASISYKPPSHLFPHQLHTLGVSYFKSRDDEKAAVLFTFLTNLDDQPQFKTAKELLLTGVSWYRVDNFELADFYFDKVLTTATHVDNLKSHAQARLWKGLVAERIGKHQKAQALLREILDNHPSSAEARWVNPTTTRGHAAKKVAAEHEAEGAHRDVAAEE